ncbi:cytochrome b6-f complex subunit PetL [Leptolyngbya ohadii]|nr:cytochrome b6-f complex subunit PetL [Leptolyngbya ohadii]
MGAIAYLLFVGGAAGFALAMYFGLRAAKVI